MSLLSLEIMYTAHSFVGSLKSSLGMYHSLAQQTKLITLSIVIEPRASQLV